MSDPISTAVTVLVIVVLLLAPLLLILINLGKIRKRDREMRDLQQETNRLLSEIAERLKENPKLK